MVTTKDIVTEFMRIKLKQRKYTVWLEHNPNKEKSNKKQKDKTNHDEKLNQICQLLDRISNDLVQFIKQNRSQFEMFKQMIEELIDNFEYDNFVAMADEVFSKGVCWSHIVTILVVAMEFACNAQEVDVDLVISTEDSEVDDIIKRRGEMVWELIDWISNYFEQRVDYWIRQQPGGWMDVKSLDDNLNNSRTSYRQYFGMAAIGVAIGTLYMCAKF